jgi:nucleotide-binding universal stress UspA family protein
MVKANIFKRILLPVDDSTASLDAQELTVFLAKKFDSKVTVLYVVSHELMIPEVANLVAEHGAQEFAPSQIARGEFSMPRQIPLSSGPRVSKGLASEITSWYHQRGDEIMGEVTRLFKDEGITVENKVVEQRDPANAIIKLAEEGDYDVIIMGRSGEKHKETHLGSTAEKVSRHAKIPVLITGEKRKVSKILIAIDGSKSADKALQHAATLAKATDATKISLVYVAESGLFKLNPEAAKQIGKHILARAARKVKDMKVDQKTGSGDPARVITDVAEKEDYDVIVMGNKGRGGVKRFLLGSVSDHVLHYSNHAVFIVK